MFISVLSSLLAASRNTIAARRHGPTRHRAVHTAGARGDTEHDCHVCAAENFFRTVSGLGHDHGSYKQVRG